MLRVLLLAFVLLAVLAASAQAQLVSNPVLTGWTPYAPVSTYTALRPVAPSPCCTPPVTSYCDPCGQIAVVPTTTYYAPTQVVLRTPSRRVPTSACCAPTTVSYHPVTTSYRLPATTVYRTSGAYLAPAATVGASAPVPTTSYYAPATIGTSAYSVPTTSSSGCGCRGG